MGPSANDATNPVAPPAMKYSSGCSLCPARSCPANQLVICPNKHNIYICSLDGVYQVMNKGHIFILHVLVLTNGSLISYHIKVNMQDYF